MQILFVPFWTDTKNGYLRVRACAQARAIENECYVAITGSVGNLPKVENMDIQYSQSAVFSPSDFAFPHDAVVAESHAQHRDDPDRRPGPGQAQGAAQRGLGSQLQGPAAGPVQGPMDWA